MNIANPPLRRVILSGQLGKRYGKIHRFALDTNTPAEAFAALISQKPGFSADLMQSKGRGIGYAVFVGDRNITEEELTHPVGNEEIRIVPMVIGAKNGGVFSIILGVVIIAAATMIGGPVGGAQAASWYGAAMGVGISMVAGGVVQLLTPMPKGTAARDRPENTPSYAFNGPINTQA